MSSKGRIVVIDDEVNAAAALETLLKEDGYDVAIDGAVSYRLTDAARAITVGVVR